MSEITKKYRDWYECKLCGFAFDTEDMNSKDGKITYKCKDCAREENKLKMRKYYNSPSGKLVIKRINREQYLRFPEKAQARQKLNMAVKHGLLKRLPCAYCNSTKGRIEAHHEDYTRPLDVIWFCSLHHRQYERKEINI